MKAKYFIWMVTIALFGSCSNEDNLLNDSLGENVVSASIEGANSRVGFEYANRTGQFFWSEGDAIGVYHGTSFYKYNLQGNGGGSTGNFKAEQTTITGASQLCALYPYNSNHKVSGNSVQFYMSPEYTYANEDSEFGNVNGNPTNVPMLAKIATEGSTNFTFGHLGGALCFKFINVPAGASKFVFTANSKITGWFEVSETDNDPKISTSTSSSDNTVTINFTAKDEATTKVFYVPMPNGTYTGFTWKFLNSSSDELKTYTTTTAVNTITDGKLLTITYTLDGSGIGNIASTASNMTDLKNALESGDDNIQLTANIELTDNLNVSENTTIDLNGQNLNAGSNTITVGESKSLTLTNNSASGVARSATTSGISGSGDIIIASKGSTITIGEGVDLITTGAKSCCVWIPSGAENVTLNTAGNLKATSAGAAVIYHNGLLGSGTINITGGSVEHETDVAVYIAGKANVTVSGNARITGTTAMEVRAGKLTVNGGKFEATASPSDYTPNGNGTTSVGVALAMVKHSTTENDLEVVINDGEFAGVKSLLVNKDLGEVSVTVNGGTFSEPTALNYLGNNAIVKVVLNDNYVGQGFETFSGQTVVLDLNNKTYNATDPLVGSNNTKSQAFHFEKGSNITIKNGTLTSAQARMFMQNYTDLTLENVTLNPTIPEETTSKYYYVLSNNSGNVNLVGKTSIIAPIKEGIESFAFDVCQYASYPAPEVNVETTGTIQGLVEVSGGTLNVKAGTFKNEKGHCVKVVTGTANFSGGTFVAQEVAVFNMAGNVNITGGVFTSNDNAVISGNGTNEAKYKGGTINISGGTFNANIQTAGYVACGIYHPQKGTLKVTGGTFNVEKGCGILMRGGSLDMTGSKATFDCTGSNTGKVGDSRVVVPCGWQIVRDDYSAYYDAENITINGVSDEYIYKIENQQ